MRIGDTGVLDVEPLELPNGRVVSRALDNRVGCYVAARAAQLVAEAGGAPGDFLAMAVVQEEIGLKGAQTSAFRHRPDVAIAIDVTHASDTPGITLGQDTHHKLGSGPVIERASTAAPARVRAAVTKRPRPRRSRSRSPRPRASRAPTPTRSPPAAPASRPDSCRCRCATCTRPSRWSASRTSRMPPGWSRRLSRRLEPGVSFTR